MPPVRRSLLALMQLLVLQSVCPEDGASRRRPSGSLCALGNASSAAQHDVRVAPWTRAAGAAAPRSPHDLLFTKWSNWSPCSRTCISKRHRRCKIPSRCKTKLEQEEAFCYVKDSFCFKWIYERVCTSESEDDEYDYEEYHDYDNEDYGSYEDLEDPLDIEETTCGVPQTKASALTRIIGGRPSKKGHWPWQVVILNRSKRPFCGGTLVGQNWVLTAAHCVRKTLYARLGEYNLNKDEGNELELKVVQSVAHPDYDVDTVDNDLALLKLQRPKGYQNLACLPQPGQLPPQHQLCTIIGWGKKKASDREGTHVLHQTEVYVMPQEKCVEMYHDYHITQNMFCAGHPSRRDSCAGDSGGPLLCQVDHRWVIFGVTSFGEGCGKKGKFGVYTLVPNYVQWIRRTINAD